MLHFESFAEFWLRITVVMQYRDDKSPDEELCIKDLIFLMNANHRDWAAGLVDATG